MVTTEKKNDLKGESEKWDSAHLRGRASGGIVEMGVHTGMPYVKGQYMVPVALPLISARKDVRFRNP